MTLHTPTMGVIHSPTLPTPRLFKSLGDDTSTAILTYPVVDAEGEWIQPDGGDWSRYPLNPKVDWHHGEPIGRGEVTLKAVSVAGKNWVVPVGTTRFANTESDFDGVDLRIPGRDGRPTSKSYSRAECLHVAQQAKQLVLADIATGVSIELDPLDRKPLGKSLLKGGMAYSYGRWVGLGWAHTLAGQQVNPGAQTVAKALDLARSGKLPDGEAMLPVIRKAFEPLTVGGKSATVTSGWKGKAMADDYVSDPVPDADMGTDTMPPPDATEESDTPPEASDAYEAAQVLADAAQKLRERGTKSLHKPSKKYYLKLADKLEADSEDLIAHAEDVEAEAGTGDTSEPTDEPTDDEPAEGEGPDIPTDDDDPTKKAHRLRYDADGFPVGHAVKLERNQGGGLVLKSMYIPRLRLKDLKPVGKANPAELSTDEAAEFERLMSETLALAPRPNRRRTTR